MRHTRPPITEKEVHDAMDALNAAGTEPSYRKVRKELGDRGSFSDLKGYIRSWHPKDRPETPLLPLPDAISAAALELGQQIWSVALQKAEALMTEKLAGFAAAKNTAEVDLQQMTKTADEYAADNDRLRDEHTERTAKFDQACEWARQQELEATALRAEVTTLREALAQILTAKAPKKIKKGAADGPASNREAA